MGRNRRAQISLRRADATNLRERAASGQREFSTLQDNCHSNAIRHARMFADLYSIATDQTFPMPVWKDTHLEGYRRWQEMTIETRAVPMAMQMAIHEVSQVLDDGGNVIEFAIGQGLEHPLMIADDLAKRKIQWIAIEPDEVAFHDGIDSQRIPNNTINIPSSQPPYYLPETSTSPSAGLILGISAFHILGRPKMQEALHFLIQKCLKDGGVFLNLQQVSPSGRFLRDWDEDTYQRISEYLSDKYDSLNILDTDLTKDGNFIQKYYEAILRYASASPYYEIGHENKTIELIKSSPDLFRFARNSHVHIPQAWKKTLEVLGGTDSALNVNRPSGYPDVRETMHTFYRYMNLFQNYPKNLITPDIMKAYDTFEFVGNIFFHDLFELFLKDLLNQEGLIVAGERLGVHYNDPRNPNASLLTFDSQIMKNFHPELGGYWGYTRRVVGIKK